MRALLLLILLAVSVAAAEYRGKWTSSRSGNGGDIRMQLEQDSDVVFTIEGSEVKAKVARSAVEGANVELEFHFSIEGNELKSVFKGTKEEGKLNGKYVTSVRGDGTPVDGGTIEASTGN